jgi:glutathione S-transferase
MITIHNFSRGIRGVRVFWLCEEMGLPYRVEVVSYPPSAEYLSKHPLGSVPFLEDEGGVAINESVAMLLYVATRYGPTPLLPEKDDPRLARVLSLTVLGEASIGAPVNTLLAAHFAAPEDEKRNWSVRGLESHVPRILGYVIGVLGDGPFLSGESLTLADISVSTALGLWRGALGKELPGELVAYRERIAARPTYQRALEKARGPAPGA